MRPASVALAFTLLSLPTAQAQDVRDNEIMIVDEACVEQKITKCIIDLTPEESIRRGDKCPLGMGFLRNTPNYRKLCKFTDPVLLMNNRWDDFENRLTKCKKRVENFPSQYGSPSCLRPLAQERIINALNVEIKRLSRQLCAASGGSKCEELDRVPDQ